MKGMPDDLHVLTGSYVLDAISDAEREEFERHLQTCPTCEAEVRGLRENVQIVRHALHQFTSMQSRILINPSLIRVFTVPSATPSSFATSG